MSLSVAIIEPDTNIASHVEQAFTKLGFEAHVLGEGDPFEFVKNKSPSVILLNVELAKGSGYSLCNRLKKQADLKRIPIILTSGQETAEAFAQHQRSQTHADVYMHKPFSVDQLVDAVGKLVPEAFPNGKPAMPAGNGNGETFGGAAGRAEPAQAEQEVQPPPMGDISDDEPRPPARADGGAPSGQAGPAGAPPPRARVARPQGDSPRNVRPGAGPSLDELIAQGRTEQPPQPPSNAAGHEAKTAFLRETLKQKEQDIARARELWSTREREMSQLTEVLELRERELERARKAREDLLAQLTATEDKVAALRLDVELGAERAERLEREKKALNDEVENVTNELERNIMQLQSRGQQLEEAFKAEQAARAEENDRSATEIRDLVNDLDRVRTESSQREAEFNEADAQARSLSTELQGRIAGLDAEMGNLRGKLVDAQKDGEALKRELGSLRAEKASDDERARTLVEELETRIRDLSFDKDGVEAELSRSLAELADREAKLTDAFSRITDMEADLADTQGRLSETGSILQQSETRAQELQNELAETQQHALEVSQEKNRLELKLQETQRELATSQERYAITSGELDETKQRASATVRDLESRISAFKENIADLEDKVREGAATQQHLEGQLKDTELRLEEKHRDWDQERVNRQKDVLKRDQRIADLENKNRELDVQVHETERAAKQREAELAHELDVQRARGEELDRDLNRSRVKGTELEGLLENAKGRLTEFAKEIKRGEAKVAALTDENAVATERVDELTRLLEEQKERTAFAEAELGEEKANHAQDLQAHTGALDRTSQQAKDRVEKLQDALQKLKAELGATQADAAATKDRLARAEEKSAKVEAAFEREQREKQQMVDRNSVLDEEVEGAQARSEALTDEITRLKAAVKRAQDEAAIAKKERLSIEERYKNEEHTMVKRVEDAKMSALEAQGKVREDVDRVTKERDDARAQALEIRRIAETLKTKYKTLEASVADNRGSSDQKVQRLADELRIEKEARARENANSKAEAERLKGQLETLSTQAVSANDVELTTLKAQVRERDEKLTKAVAEYNAMRERAKDALGKLKEMGEKQKVGAGDGELKARVEQLTGKYNEVVQKLKQQVELNKKIDAAYKELAEKHRKALVLLKEHREAAASESTQILKPPSG